MSAKQFKLDASSNSYAYRLQRTAVLFPLCGIARTPVGVVAKTHLLLSSWRARLLGLSGLGVYLRAAPTALHAGLNCRPAFSFVADQALPCNCRWFCPFCYARATSDLWEQLRPVVRQFSQRGGWQLVERRRNWDMPAKVVRDGGGRSEDEQLAHLLANSTRYWQPLIEAVTPAGAHCQVSMEPLPDGGWRLRQRQVFLMPLGTSLPEDLAVYAKTWPATVTHLFKILGRHCRYPTLMMRGDLAQVGNMLLTKLSTRKRFSAAYGVFRGNYNVED